MVSLLPLLGGCLPPRTPPQDTATPPPTQPVPFSVIGFNVESGGSDYAVVADEVVADMRGESLWGFAEVESEAAADRLVEAAADPDTDQRFEYVIGSTGWSDLLVLAWDDTVFSLDSWEELHDINVGGTVRAPVVGRLTDRASGLPFLLVVNHLWRTEADKRHVQAELLNEWGAGQSEPVVMVGDYNFDWEVETGDHDLGYDLLTEGDVFEWVRPETLVKSQCSGWYESVLDFVFVGGDARGWDAASDILRPDETYCAGSHRDTWSDHRPVRGRFGTP